MQNVASLGFDLDDLVARRLLFIDHVRVERSEVESSGDYDLEGLFIRLDHAIRSVGARRVVLDTLETLFASLPNPAILRAELRRLFRWLKDRGVTAIITGERGSEPGALTRQGLEEYVSDCVIVLDHRVVDMASSRAAARRQVPRLDARQQRIPVPHRRDRHLGAAYHLGRAAASASNERVSSGLDSLDAMLGGPGFFRGQQRAGGRHRRPPARPAWPPRSQPRPCRRGERGAVLRLRGVAQPDRAQHALDRHRPGAGTRAGAAEDPRRRPTLLGWRCTCPVMLKEVSGFDPQAVVVDPLSSFPEGGRRRRTCSACCFAWWMR